MKHSRSSAETEIRDAVVKRFRELWPDARIIHEMNVEHGSSRADVVAVQPNRLWICEIKSERDKLDRLVGQLRDFGPACHGMIVAAHERWTREGETRAVARPATKVRCASTAYITEPSKLDAATRGCGIRFEEWSYPETPAPLPRQTVRAWEMPYWKEQVPWYHRMLVLLWADELRAVAAEHRVACDKRTPAYKLVPDLSRILSGAEIEKAVCKYLRARRFAEADPPIDIPAKTFAPHPAQRHQQEAML